MKTKCPLIIITIEAKGCPYLQGCRYCQDIEIGPQNGDSWCRGKIRPDDSNSPLSAGLAMLLEDAKSQLEWFENEAKTTNMSEANKQYYLGSRDAYAYMISAIQAAMNG